MFKEYFNFLQEEVTNTNTVIRLDDQFSTLAGLYLFRQLFNYIYREMDNLQNFVHKPNFEREINFLKD